MTLTKFLLSVLAVSPPLNLGAQVTIGSSIPSNPGALIDFKQSVDITGNINANRGINMPRVKIISTTIPEGQSLAQTIEGTAPTDNWDKDQHIGLMVYHVDRCTLGGSGLYLWDGVSWQKAGDSNPDKLNFSQSYIDLPSGHDARGDVSPRYLSAYWSNGLEVTWQKLPSVLPVEVSLQDPASLSGALTVPGENITLLAKVMPKPDAASPWQSYESKLTFNTKCGQRDIILNQTNYAIIVNNRSTDFTVDHKYVTNGTFSFPVQTNVVWKTLIYDPSSMLVSVDPSFESYNGEDNK